MRTDEGTALPSTAPKTVITGPAVEPAAQAMQTIDHGRIEPSPLNPRKTFDQEKIAQLAESIAVQGVLQNLVVRPHAKNLQRYEIAAGESRWRAVQLLIKAGRLPANFGMPCRVRPLTDRELLELALTENVQRKDLSALEEAHAFKRLVDMKVGTDEIAQRVGCSRRHVQLRLALVDKLHPKAQKALADGTFGPDHARELTRAPLDLQPALVERMTPDAHGHSRIADVRDLRIAVQAAIKGITVDRALFDRGLYKGEIRKDEQDPSIEYFADAAQFDKLQTQAIDARKIELRKKWKWVELIEHWGNNLPHHYQSKPNADKAGALLIIDRNTGKLHIYEGVINRLDPKRGGTDPSRLPSSRPRNDAAKGEKFDAAAFLHHIGNIKTNALRVATINGGLAPTLRLALAFQNGAFDLSFDISSGGFMREANQHPAIKEARGKYLEPLRANLVDDNKMVAHLGKMNERDLANALAVSIAESVDAYSDDNGDPDETLSLARLTGADVRKVWTFAGKQGEAFLALCSSRHLAVMAAELGLPAAADTKPATLRTLRAEILKASARSNYLPPWLTWIGETDLKKRVETATKKPAAPKPTPAAKSKKKR